MLLPAILAGIRQVDQVQRQLAIAAEVGRSRCRRSTVASIGTAGTQPVESATDSRRADALSGRRQTDDFTDHLLFSRLHFGEAHLQLGRDRGAAHGIPLQRLDHGGVGGGSGARRSGRGLRRLDAPRLDRRRAAGQHRRERQPADEMAADHSGTLTGTHAWRTATSQPDRIASTISAAIGNTTAAVGAARGFWGTLQAIFGGPALPWALFAICVLAFGFVLWRYVLKARVGDVIIR